MNTPTTSEAPAQEHPSAKRGRIIRELLAESSLNGANVENRTLGDLILLMLTPEQPKYIGPPEYALMHIAALELRAIAMASASIEAGGDDLASDDQLTARDVATLTAALASRLDASAELCRRLTEARWSESGFAGRPVGGDDD